MMKLTGTITVVALLVLGLTGCGDDSLGESAEEQLKQIDNSNEAVDELNELTDQSEEIINQLNE